MPSVDTGLTVHSDAVEAGVLRVSPVGQHPNLNGLIGFIVLLLWIDGKGHSVYTQVARPITCQVTISSSARDKCHVDSVRKATLKS